MTAPDHGATSAPQAGQEARHLEDWERPYPSDAIPRLAERERAPENPLDALWRRWCDARDLVARDALVDRYFPLVGHVARSLAAKLSSRADIDDLIGFGAEGLLDAISRFDPARGVQFGTFAAHRIRGAIYDGIRAIDWAPRVLRRRDREFKENAAWLRQRFGREPTELEQAELYGLSLVVFRRLTAQLHRAGIGSLEDARVGEESTVSSRPGPLEMCLQGEEKEEIAAAIGRLGEREQLIISLSYGEGRSLAEIGRILGVTESRVCQVRGKALARMRDHLAMRGLAPV
jgi:RNA polymerase sigma factor for flagellar operon FliA